MVVVVHLFCDETDDWNRIEPISRNENRHKLYNILLEGKEMWGDNVKDGLKI